MPLWARGMCPTAGTGSPSPALIAGASSPIGEVGDGPGAAGPAAPRPSTSCATSASARESYAPAGALSTGDARPAHISPATIETVTNDLFLRTSKHLRNVRERLVNISSLLRRFESSSARRSDFSGLRRHRIGAGPACS